MTSADQPLPMDLPTTASPPRAVPGQAGLPLSPNHDGLACLRCMHSEPLNPYMEDVYREADWGRTRCRLSRPSELDGERVPFDVLTLACDRFQRCRWA